MDFEFTSRPSTGMKPAWAAPDEGFSTPRKRTCRSYARAQCPRDARDRATQRRKHARVAFRAEPAAIRHESGRAIHLQPAVYCGSYHPNIISFLVYG